MQKYHSDDLTFNFDYKRIYQVLINLISNAFKYSPQDGQILIEVKENSMYVGGTFYPAIAISVADFGSGIKEEELENIFEKFKQSSGISADTQGSGLGLAICKDIVNAHKGMIWAENHEFGGAKISFTIPKNIKSLINKEN